MFALPVACYERLDWMARFRSRVDDRVRDEAVARFLPEFQRRYAQRLRLPGPDFLTRIGPGDEMLQDLQRDGCALGALASDDRRRIRELTLPLADQVRAALDLVEHPRFADGQIRLDHEVHWPIFDAVSRALEECGAMQAVCAYAGAALVLATLGLQANTAKETLSKYGDLDRAGLPERPTSYFHVDSNDWPGVKVLIYLSDVGPEQGPFRYVAGSHRLMGPYEAAVRKTNDKMKHTGTVLCALPTHFAQHANFGDHIDPDTPESRNLLAREMVVCDGRSDLVLFDNNGVHRGGMVRDGHRYMLQCMFSRPAKVSRVREEARSFQPSA